MAPNIQELVRGVYEGQPCGNVTSDYLALEEGSGMYVRFRGCFSRRKTAEWKCFQIETHDIDMNAVWRLQHKGKTYDMDAVGVCSAMVNRAGLEASILFEVHDDRSTFKAEPAATSVRSFSMLIP
jgi:hypothetical protein